MRLQHRSDRAGFTFMETLCAIALLAIALTCCYEVLYRGHRHDALAAEAALRSATAERLMEQTLAQPWGAVASRRVQLNTRDVNGHSGWHAEIRVSEPRPGLKQVTVIVYAGSRTTELRTIVTQWRSSS